jgi:uncharacterized membrane protein YhaH (DUF805 family)
MRFGEKNGRKKRQAFWVGQILLSLGYLTSPQINEVINSLGGCPGIAILSKIEECPKKLPQAYS